MHIHLILALFLHLTSSQRPEIVDFVSGVELTISHYFRNKITVATCNLQNKILKISRRILLNDEQLKTLKLAFFIIIIFKHKFYIEEEETENEDDQEVDHDDSQHL